MERIKFKDYMDENTDVLLDNLIYNYINDYPTDSEYGFTPEELAFVVSEIKAEYEWNDDKWWNAMMGNTCMIIDNVTRTYHCDIVTGIMCAIQNRDMKVGEFD